jgi:hypothetical protein
MTNPIPPFVVCSLCHKSVELESSKTDEQGKAVHEECYVEDLAKRLARTLRKMLTTHYSDHLLKIDHSCASVLRHYLFRHEKGTQRETGASQPLSDLRSQTGREM